MSFKIHSNLSTIFSSLDLGHLQELPAISWQLSRLMTKDDLRLMSWCLSEADDNWNVFVNVRIQKAVGEDRVGSSEIQCLDLAGP